MRLVDIIPHERDLAAAKMYKFMDWFCRKHRELIKDKAEQAISLMTLYGKGCLETMWEGYNPISLKETQPCLTGGLNKGII